MICLAAETPFSGIFASGVEDAAGSAKSTPVQGLGAIASKPAGSTLIHLFSIAAITDGTGAVVERYGYDAYGERIVLDASGTTELAGSTVGQPYRFTGRRLDSETGLSYFRARYMDHQLGRFIGRDIFVFVGMYNRYASYFVPHRVDPSGYEDVNPPPSDNDGEGREIEIRPPWMPAEDISDDDGFVNDDEDNPVGRTHPGDMNCLGYATGCDQALEPSTWEGEMASMADLMSELGYDCVPMASRDDCEAHCNCKDYLFLYIYIPRESPLGPEDFEGKDPFNDPIFDPARPGDTGFHAQRGEGGGVYTQVSGYYHDVGDDIYGNVRIGGPFNFENLLGSYCCCRPE